MKFRKILWLMIVTMLAVILSACNLGATPAPTLDLGAIQTQAFSAVMTQAVLQYTPTPLPTNTLQPTATLSALATFAPIGGGDGVSTVTPFALTPFASLVPTVGVGANTTKNGCNDGIYVDEGPYYTDAYHFLDVNIGEVVEQFFRYRNTGTCTWDEGYAFVFQPETSSPELQGNTFILAKNKITDYTGPGSEVRYKAIIKAPKNAGDYFATWKLRDDGGNEFGSLVSLYIRVRQP